jgi:hypothetical protein
VLEGGAGATMAGVVGLGVALHRDLWRMASAYVIGRVGGGRMVVIGGGFGGVRSLVGSVGVGNVGVEAG